MAEIGFAEAIQQLRGELELAVARRPQDSVYFPVEGVTVELQVGLTREGGANGGIRLHVLELGASGKYSKETVQTVTITLGTPVGPTGKPIWVGAQSATKPE